MRLLILLFATSSAFGATLDLSKATSKVEFLAIGKPSLLKIRGVAKQDGEKKPLEGALKVEGDSVKGEAKFEMATLETGIALRDRHMKEKYLETAKFPKGEFKFSEMKLPAALKNGDGKASDVPFKGTLTVHGVPQPVEGKAKVEKKGSQIQFEFAFGTKIPAFNMGVPSFMGVTVAEDVQVTVAVEGPLA